MITDTLYKPLPYANILAKPLSQQVDMAFAISDEKGRYKLVLEANEKYTISVFWVNLKQKK